MAGIVKFAKEKEKGERFLKVVENLIGKDGYMVELSVNSVEDGRVYGLLIRFKDGKALIASLPN
jgi:hypothetical protein